jgi:hypothetical protein
MTSTHVFVGPSLPWDEGRSILPSAVFRPPAKAGDVYLAVADGADVIAIIDGYFEQVPAPWHKEVLYALSAGAHVFGAASMGALRAAELYPFGMVGVGRIFEAYRQGTYEDDDEVAVVHGGEDVGFAVGSEAMVNVRDTLSRAVERELIRPASADAIVREMKRQHYPHRSWLLVHELASRGQLATSEVDQLLAFIRSEKPDRKRQDAVELMMVLREFTRDPVVPFEPAFEFESTVFWDQLVSGARTGPGASAGISIEAIRSHVGLVEDDADSIFQGALLLYLVVKEAHRVGLVLDPDKVEVVANRFRLSHGLDSASAIKDWLRRNALGEAEFWALMEVLALVEAVAKHHSTGLDAFLPAELQRRGRFEPVVEAITRKREALASFGNTFPSAEDVNTTIEGLLVWYERHYRQLDHTFEDHLAARRFNDANRFMRELISEYVRHHLHSEGSVPADD